MDWPGLSIITQRFPMLPPNDSSLISLVQRSQVVMAHAWTVRAFVRHSDEVEDFPELGEIGRAVFDLSRALEAHVDDPAGYFKMLQKKLGKFRAAVEQFAVDAPKASAHTNFAQAVMSIRGCADELQAILEQVAQRKVASASSAREHE